MLPAIKKLLKRTSSPIACLDSVSLASATLSAVALIAVTAVPASASVPGGQGLGIFGLFDCGDPLGEVEVFGAPAVEAANAYLIDTEGTGPHVVATRFEFKSAAGDVFFEKNFGKKAGLTTFNCTQTGDLGDVFTLTVAVVPPH
jgi:hypothetical protein